MFGLVCGVCLELVWRFERMTIYVGSLRAKTHYKPQAWVSVTSWSKSHYPYNILGIIMSNVPKKILASTSSTEKISTYSEVLPTSILWQPGSATLNSLTPGQQNILNCVFRFERTLFSMQPLLIGHKDATSQGDQQNPNYAHSQFNFLMILEHG